MRRPAVLLLALVLAIIGAAPARATLTPAQAYARSAVNATNTIRVGHDLVSLKVSSCLADFANRQARLEACNRALSHQRLAPIRHTCHLAYAAENIAYGFTTGRSVVRDGWMHSAPHRANILTPRFRLIAVGAARGSDGYWYVSQVFGQRA